MTFLQWRRFNLFDKEVVKEKDSDQPLDKLKDILITCTTSGRGLFVIGDSDGNIHFLSRQLHLNSFKAFEVNVQFVEQLKQNAILVTVGSDELGSNPVVKIFNTEKNDQYGKPVCIRIIKSALAINSLITAFAVHENLSLLALGFDDGVLLLIRGDITRERQSKVKTLQLEEGPITNLIFRTMGKHTVLFTTTPNEVIAFNLLSKDKEEKVLLDKHGCEHKCAVLSDVKQLQQFVIGRKDAVYFYQHDARGSCFVFEGEKNILHWFKSYLVIIGKEKALQSTSVPSVDRSIVTVYDMQNKFIAFAGNFPGVIDIISEWGSIYIICHDGKMFSLQEKDTQSKLDMLFKKNLYSMAITLAKTQQYDEDGLIDIFRQYGDHLYTKGDYDGAILQYKRTIGKLEASYVIRKFLDAQRIHNLTDYLQSLHQEGLASEDHTTLLLNCYTKLKDVSKLDEFIMPKDREVHFDVEIAMKVCRQAGYYRHALYLAQKHNQHDWYLKIQIENLKDYEKALSYIADLVFIEAEANMKKYGKILMTEIPEQTTEFLKRLCTTNTPDRTMGDGSSSIAEEFIHIFDRNYESLMEFLEHIRKVQPQYNSSLIFNALLELYLQCFNNEASDVSKKSSMQQKIMGLLELLDPNYKIDEALVLCKVSNFTPGILYLYERAKLYQQILFYHMENNDYENVIRTCNNFGSNDPNLWVQALWFFCQLEQNQKSYIATVLNEIEAKHLLSPILVVEIMSKSHTATLELIKDYVCRHLQKENEQINEDEARIAQYKKDTDKMRRQIEELKTQPKIFQVSKCSGCNHPLELPSVHFLCNHSYHQQCFESYSADAECPMCLEENKEVLSIIRAQEQHGDLDEVFHHQLERNEDSFSVVADYFGRGVFNKVTLVMDPMQRVLKSSDIAALL